MVIKTINKLENSKNKFYSWDDTKRAQKALFSLWFHLKRKKNVISRSKTLKEIKAQNDMILKYLLFIFVVLCLLLPFSCYLFGDIGSLNCV